LATRAGILRERRRKTDGAERAGATGKLQAM